AHVRVVAPLAPEAVLRARRVVRGHGARAVRACVVSRRRVFVVTAVVDRCERRSATSPKKRDGPHEDERDAFHARGICNRETTLISLRIARRRAPLCAVYCEQCPTIAPTSRPLPGLGGSLV